MSTKEDHLPQSSAELICILQICAMVPAVPSWAVESGMLPDLLTA